MADTLESSLRSMVNQIPEDTFEVVVVDGGSTDGSRDILRSLEVEYPNLRAVLDRADECNHLGGDRNISFEEARGEYVLESMDTDDRYFEGIVRDFISIYHQIENVVEYPFFLSGTGINMAPRKLLFDIPYYDLGGAEDRDLYRRLFHSDNPLWLDHGPISKEIGYDMNWQDEIRRDIHGKICDFQSGITLLSALRWSLFHKRWWILERNRGFILNSLKKPYDFLTHCYAYWKARARKQHNAPPGYKEKGELEKRIAEVEKTLPELEAAYGFNIDRESFSEAGYEAFVEYAEA